MNNITKSLVFAGFASIALAPVVMADEMSATSVSTGGGAATTHTIKAQSGPGGAKISKTKTNVQGNIDGSVSTNREHESHSMTDFGSAHHKSSSSTTVNPDGSSSSIQQSTHVEKP